MKKVISVFAIAFLFMSLMSPIVRADITLTTEFVDPVKNWSFEERSYGPPYPCGGVYKCPPWETNNGGYRDVPGDIDDSGKCDWVDQGLLGNAYGSHGPDYGYPGQQASPNWNPDADIDGSGKVTWNDLGILGMYFGKTANRLDGVHSWYTSGGGDYQMWQYLDSDTLNVVKGKDVTFAFWFLPESVASDGLQNYARAEIQYWFTYKIDGQTYYDDVLQWGDWVYPTETKWHTAVVTTSTLPSTTYKVKVVIHGQPNFKAWIDQTSLSITETKSVEDGNRKLSMAVNLFRSFSILEEPKGRAFLGVSVAADYSSSTYPYHWITQTEIKAELLSGASITIRNVTQSNNLNYTTDPDQTERIENQWIVAGQIAAGTIVGGVVFFVTQGLAAPAIADLLLGATAEGVVSYLMANYRSDADIPFTDEVGGHVKARIGYAGEIHFANERCRLELAFYSGTTCQIEVTVKATFRAINYLGQILEWTLEKSTLVTVSL